MIVKKTFIKTKKHLKINKNLKNNLKFNKNNLKFNKNNLFFTNKNYLRVKNLIYEKNKKKAQGNFLIDFFK